MSHPSESEIAEEDAYRALDAARRILDKLGSDTASELRQLARKVGAYPEKPEREPLSGYLPPRDSIAPSFIGRERELQGLWRWLGDSDRRRWAMVGAGGVGKSAIAYAFAVSVRDRAPDSLTHVVWLSAKRRRFVEGQTTEIAQPDFSDLRSAVRFILYQFGWPVDEQVTDEQRKNELLQLLQAYPTLLVVDDVDSLEGEGEDAIEFFATDVGRTASKVLFTSRRQPFGFGASLTTVRGFGDDADGQRFVQSRLALFSLPNSILRSDSIKRIIATTDGSPLYIEDLLRLSAVGIPIDQALQAWAEHHGDDARQYSLRREMELLTREAREILIANAVADSPLSYTEIRVITALGEGACGSGIDELQRLFLLPQPSDVEGVMRFALNNNTKLLVSTIEKGSARWTPCESAYRALRGDIVTSRVLRQRAGEYVHEAVALVKQGDHAGAEQVLKKGLEAFPNDPVMLGQLGWVYRRWQPAPRVTDARNAFARAADLHCPDPEMYRHWSELELDEQEWRQAFEAAARGLGANPGSATLLYLAGRAKSSLGRDLMLAMQPRAESELREADELLRSALDGPYDESNFRAIRLRSRLYRCIVLNAERFVDFYRRQGQLGSASHHALRGLTALTQWSKEHPDDDVALSEGARLQPRFEQAARR